MAEKESDAAREARQIAHAHTQREEGRWVGGIKVEDNPFSAKLVERYNEAAEDLRACPHLQKNFDQPRFWVEAVPELLACKQCTPAVAREEQARANSCCVLCGSHAKLRGFTVASGPLVMRGGFCGDCEQREGPQL